MATVGTCEDGCRRRSGKRARGDRRGSEARGYGTTVVSNDNSDDRDQKGVWDKARQKSVVSNDNVDGEDRSFVACDDKRRKRQLGGSMDSSTLGKKRKKTESVPNQGDSNEELLRIDGDGGLPNMRSKKSPRRRKSKKVTFSDQNEVFPFALNGHDHDGNECRLIDGKRYTKEEDQMIEDAIIDVLKPHGLGWKDAHMLYKIKENPQLRHCWKEISSRIPWRPRKSIYDRANLLVFQRPKRSWTEEEIELLKKYRAEHGKYTRWKDLCDTLNRYRQDIKDAWRRNRLPNEKKGSWSQEEYQQLFDLVNMDLRMKSLNEEPSKSAMFKENISWTAISDAIGTRLHPHCCMKWYDQLASPMVALGSWLDSDDYRLIDALTKLDASCAEDVDWDNLVENRSGNVCRQRWKEMTRHIGGKKEKSFMEQVELLSTRYCKDMLQYRTKQVQSSNPAMV